MKIAKANTLGSMKQLLLPQKPEELNQNKSETANLEFSTKKSPNDMIQVSNTNKNTSIDNFSTNIDIDNATFSLFSATNDNNSIVNGELFNANTKCNKLKTKSK